MIAGIAKMFVLFSKKLSEILTLDKLHREVGSMRRQYPVVEDPDEVGMLELRECLEFSW